MIKERVEQLRSLLIQSGCDTYLSLAPPINEYLTGFRGSTSAAVVTDTTARFLCDFRYTEQAVGQVSYFDIEEFTGSLSKRVGDVLNSLNAGKAAFEPAYIQYDQWQGIAEAFKGELRPQAGMTARLRMRKSPAEIEAIRTASALAEGVLADALETLKPGMEERELAAWLEYEFKRRGASGASFDTIALFGARSSLPHGEPGAKRLEHGDIVLLDFGCRLHGYCSDLTRTYVFGTIPGTWFEHVYELVRRAQRAAISAARPGMTGRELDAVARDIIRAGGHEEHFGHGLGHGLGVEIHEEPRLNPHTNTVLEPGMVVTIEPGIYIPGQGGVRIEDVIAITEAGCTVLSQTPTEFKVL